MDGNTNFNAFSNLNLNNDTNIINHGSEIERILGEINAIKRDSLNIKRVYFSDNIEILDINNNIYSDQEEKSRNSTTNKKSILKNDEKRLSNSINYKDIAHFNNGSKRNSNYDNFKNGSFYNTDNYGTKDRASILFYQSGIISDLRNRLYEDGKKRREENELKECTFQPKTEINNKLNIVNRQRDSNVYERNMLWKAQKENNLNNINISEINKNSFSKQKNEYNTFSNKTSTPNSVKKDNLFYIEMDNKTKTDLNRYKNRISEAEKRKSDSLNKAFPNYSKMYDISHKTVSNLELIGNKVGKDSTKNSNKYYNSKNFNISNNECIQIINYLKNDLYTADLEVEFD